MSAMHTSRVNRVYLVTLMPDPHTSYEPFFVTLSYAAREAARLDARSSRATSQAFRAAIEVECHAHHTPTHRRFFCGSSTFVTEWTSTASPPREHPLRRRRSSRHMTSRTRWSDVLGGTRGDSPTDTFDELCALAEAGVTVDPMQGRAESTAA